MIVSGILWRDCHKSPEVINRLKALSLKLTKFENTLFDDRGITIITGKSSDNDYDSILHKGGSFLVGRVFQKKSSAPISLSELQLLTKDSILDSYWGKYLFISSNKVQNKVSILRDPTGQLPLFYAQLPEGLIIFSSELSIVHDFLSRSPELDFPYLASNILYGSSNSTRTAFKDIHELPPGCCLTYEQNTLQVEVSWEPATYSYPKHVQPNQIVKCIESSLEAWHSPYENIFLSLSGGLDSTSLLYCLKRTQKDYQTIRAINLYHPEIQQSNELPYARKVCNDLGVELMEIDLSDLLPFSPPQKPILTKPHKPFPLLTHLRQIEKTQELINHFSSTLFVSGQGGDHIFLAPPLKTLFVDYILEKGLKGARSQLEKLNQYYRTPLYSILKHCGGQVMRHYLSSQKATFKRDVAPWMTKELQNLGSEPFIHPLYCTLTRRTKVGKCGHIQAIEKAFSSIAIDVVGGNPIYNPLLYQPAVELALSIPTYETLQEGYDRYPFRKAISKSFKTNHVWRRSKGETSGIIQLGLKKNLHDIKMLCLDGELVKHKLIKKDELQRHIKRVASGENILLWPLINFISTEIFLSYWKS